MDPKIFYGREKNTPVGLVRDFPSDSEDSMLEENVAEPICSQLTQNNFFDDSHMTDDFESEDEIPLKQLATNITVSSNFSNKNKKQLKWKMITTETNVEHVKFQGSSLLPDDILQLNTPYKIFKFFISDKFLEEVVHQTILYSTQTRPNKPINTSKEELQRFIGVAMWMSLIKQPNTRRYWAPNTRTAQIAEVMPVNRFEDIKKFIHFSDNMIATKNTDKITPLLNQIRDACLKIPLEENLSCDEQIIPFKGRISLKTYNPKKPHKWGYKMWVLSGVSGFSYNFELFSTKSNIELLADEPDLGAASNVIVRLCRVVPKNKNHKVYFDNYFTGVPLLVYLKKQGIECVGTVRSNRLPGCVFPSEKVMKLKGRGSVTELVTESEKVTIKAFQWYDNKVVSLVSTFCGTNPIQKVKRFSRTEKKNIEIECPNVVKVYNEHMGGVDLQDSLLGLYRCSIRSKKWYHRIFYHMLDVAVVNSWLLYRRIQKQLEKPDKMSLLDFKTDVANALCNVGKQATKRGRPSVENIEPPKSRRFIEPKPSNEVRQDSFDHWPELTKERERCKKTGCKGKSRVRCTKCKVHLCFYSKTNCFRSFHI